MDAARLKRNGLAQPKGNKSVKLTENRLKLNYRRGFDETMYVCSFTHVGEKGPRRPRRRACAARAGSGSRSVGRGPRRRPERRRFVSRPAASGNRLAIVDRVADAWEQNNAMAWRGPKRPPPQCPLRANPGPLPAGAAGGLSGASGRYPSELPGRGGTHQISPGPGRSLLTTLTPVPAWPGRPPKPTVKYLPTLYCNVLVC